MTDRKYIVHCKRGRLEVLVRESVISLRGERNAVAQAAWFKLMGQNELGEDVNKNSPTREILMTELLSQYEAHRDQVFETFKDKISFNWVGVVR